MLGRLLAFQVIGDKRSRSELCQLSLSGPCFSLNKAAATIPQLCPASFPLLQASSHKRGPGTVPQALSSLFPAPATSPQLTAAPAPSLKLCPASFLPLQPLLSKQRLQHRPSSSVSLSPAPATSPQLTAAPAPSLKLCPASLPLLQPLLKLQLFSAKHGP